MRRATETEQLEQFSHMGRIARVHTSHKEELFQLFQNSLAETIRELTARRGYPEREAVGLLYEVMALPMPDQLDLLEHFRAELSAWRFAGPPKQVSSTRR